MSAPKSRCSRSYTGRTAEQVATTPSVNDRGNPSPRALLVKRPELSASLIVVATVTRRNAGLSMQDDPDGRMMVEHAREVIGTQLGEDSLAAAIRRGESTKLDEAIE